MAIDVKTLFKNMDVTTVNVRFERGGTEYTFKCPRDIANHLKSDDAVLVDTSNGMKMAWVSQVHEQPKIKPINWYRWVFAKADVSRLRTLNIMEDRMRAELED